MSAYIPSISWNNFTVVESEEKDGMLAELYVHSRYRIARLSAVSEVYASESIAVILDVRGQDVPVRFAYRDSAIKFVNLLEQDGYGG